ncbi:MAG TPA: tetratricopeptide repeat protein [Pyrinomonadaceae bacterium]|nr:tetratricopeptide repeat protein [Pyrinomonadaceae bacterium]
MQRFRETKFVGMEYFGSRDETTRRASLDEVDRSRVYVGIFAARYGSGITEDEYRRASARGLYCLLYFKEDATVPAEFRETDPAKTAKLDALKAGLKRDHDVSTFDNPDDLAAKIATDLHRWLFDKYLTPILERAARGELPHSQAQELLSEVRDTSALSPALLAQLMARHQLRAPVGDFVGRGKEIAELTAVLRAGTSAAISGISGMGGIGKTELALYVANRLRDAYPDAQLVVDMRGTDDPPRDPSDALASCIRAFVGLEKKLPDDLEELTRLYRSALQGKRALILLDNARDGAQVRPLMPPTGSALMVTSRETLTLPGMKRLTLEQLQQAEARELLISIAPHVAPDIADQICYLCGYLPLAVRAAGSLLAITSDLDPTDYAEQLRDERRRLELLGTEGVDISVEASLGLSYTRLSPDAARVFRLLAIFPATFDAAAEEAICEDPGHKHLSDLLRRNLVLYNPDTRRYRLHDLARLFADSRLNEEERSAGRIRHAAQYLEVLRKCERLYLEGREAIKTGLTLFDVERRNIEAGQNYASTYADGDETAARLCNAYPMAGVEVLALRQRPHEFVDWLETALVIARKIEDRPVEGKLLSSLGVIYSYLGERGRAIEMFERGLSIAREIGDRRDEGGAMINLGNAYLAVGEVSRGIDFFEQGFVISREVGDIRGESYALGNLGNAYHRLGKNRRAIECYEQVLFTARQTGDRYSEGNAIGALGMAYAALGEARQALESFEQCLVIARDIGDRRNQINTHLNIAGALEKLGDRARAIAHAEAALKLCEQIESPLAENARELLEQLRGEA